MCVCVCVFVVSIILAYVTTCLTLQALELDLPTTPHAYYAGRTVTARNAMRIRMTNVWAWVGDLGEPPRQHRRGPPWRENANLQRERLQANRTGSDLAECQPIPRTADWSYF